MKLVRVFPTLKNNTLTWINDSTWSSMHISEDSITLFTGTDNFLTIFFSSGIKGVDIEIDNLGVDAHATISINDLIITELEGMIDDIYNSAIASADPDSGTVLNTIDTISYTLVVLLSERLKAYFKQLNSESSLKYATLFSDCMNELSKRN